MSKTNKDLLNQLKSSLSKAGPESTLKTAPPASVVPPEPSPPPAKSTAVAPPITSNIKKKPKPPSQPASKPGNRTLPASSPKTKPSPNPVKKDKSTVVSITLYPRDLDHIDQIIDYMRDNHRRITRSEAIKLALRGVSLNRQMLDIYPKIQGEDGRRK